jgi:hypothetical protein
VLNSGTEVREMQELNILVKLVAFAVLNSGTEVRE